MSYQPTWESTLHSVKEISTKEAWKTSYLSIDREDLEQEAYLVFYKCIDNKYSYENEKHFFSFFRLSFKNRIIDLIKNRRLEKEAVVTYSLENENGESYLENIKESSDSSDFNTKLKEAPEEIRAILTLLQNYPQEMISLNRITNKRICDLLGYDHNNRNLIKELKEYFKKDV